MMGKITNQPDAEESAEETQEPGLFETYGTFPVWILKVIQLFTPSFLIVQNPPKDEDTKP